METLAKPKEIADGLLAYPGVRPLALDDAQAIRAFYRTHDDSGAYARSWTYLTQATHMEQLGFPFGLVLEDSWRLAGLGVFRRPADPEGKPCVHIVHPAGTWNAEQIHALAAHAVRLSGTPCYVKKVDHELLRSLENRGFVSVRGYQEGKETIRHTWHPVAPLEDDTFPERVIDISGLDRLLDGRDPQTLAWHDNTEVARKYRRFQRRYGHCIEVRDHSPDQIPAAQAVVEAFFSPEYRRAGKLSSPADYGNMVSNPPEPGSGIMAAVTYLRDEPVGFFVAEKIRSNIGVYANLALYHRASGFSEYLLTAALRSLIPSGIRYVNLGGSETRGLDA
ncbi:MAG TPA: hypothetical protein VJB16_06900, partial [archaeon]|nr:hypothetical protein [archaeon]